MQTRMAAEAPRIIYGTAWKKDRTADLVYQAVMTGFRAIDTACQPKHYKESGVGEALRSLALEGIPREQLFLQTKYTPAGGQDPNDIPYDPTAPLAEQVRQSVAKSLANLGTDYLDSLVLHSPLPTVPQTLEVWRAFEEQHAAGRALRLGISNCYELAVLKKLWDAAAVKPSVVQNRFYDTSRYDVPLRVFCRQKGIMYQSFWTLTANPHVLEDKRVVAMAKAYGKTTAQVFFAFVMRLGITPLTGTKSVEHMRQDLDVLNFTITDDEVATIKGLMGLEG